MGIEAVAAHPFGLDTSDRDRLAALGITVRSGDAIVDPGDDGGLPNLAAAVRLGVERGALLVVTAPMRDSETWRREGARCLAAATRASLETVDRRPMTVVVLPALRAPRPGPIAVLSPAGSVSAYEIY